MANTTASEVYDSFESSFQDKKVLPNSLELMWLKKAIARYGIELSPLVFDSELLEFDKELDQYTIDILAEIMKLFYMEREVSRQNKIASIVGKDISLNGNNGLQKYNENELIVIRSNVAEMISKLKQTAYYG